MLIKKYNRILNDDNTNIIIPIKNNNDFYGEEQSINKIIKNTGNGLINPIVDGDVKRFKSDKKYVLKFFFKTPQNNISQNYETIGIPQEDINNKKPNYLNSFYFIDFYDIENTLNQKRIFRTYISKYTDNNIANMEADSCGELKHWYIPNNIINNNLSKNINNISIYARISFYNATNGKILTFKNSVSDSQFKTLYKCDLNLVNREWSFNNVSSPYIINLYELDSEVYNSKMISSANNLDNLIENPPLGSQYNYNKGSYE